MFWRRAQSAEDRAAALRHTQHLGATIYTALRSDALALDEYMILTPVEFNALRVFCLDERPETRLDCIWAAEDGAEVYRVRMDWDIAEITDL